MNRLAPSVVLGILFAVFMISRFLILWTSISLVSWMEDLSIGTIAREMLRGSGMPSMFFFLDFYSGEALVLGAMAVPFFKCMGQNLLALKMPTYLISMAVFSFSVLFIRRHFGLKAALWAGFFITFCPPIHLSHFLLVQSGHSEALLFILLMLGAFYDYLFLPGKRTVSLLVFGFFGGFGVWFYNENVLAFAACLIVWAASESRKFFSKDLIAAACAFAAGILPWVAANFNYNYLPVREVADFLPPPAAGEVFYFYKRVLKHLLIAIPRSFSFLPREDLLRIPAAYFYFALWLMPAAIYLGRLKGDFFRSLEGKKILFFLVYPMVFLGVYSLSGIPIPEWYSFLITFRYYTPFFFFWFLLMGISAAKTKIPGLIMIPLAALSLFSSAGLYFKQPPGSGLDIKGYSYSRLAIDATRFLNPSEDLCSQVLKISESFEEADRLVFIHKILKNAAWRPDIRVSLAIPPHAPEKIRRLFALELPAFAWPVYGEETLEKLLEFGRMIQEPEREYFYKGLFTHEGNFESAAVTGIIEDPSRLEKVPENFRKWFYWGMGKFYPPDSSGKYENGIYEKFLLTASPAMLRWYYRGMGSRVWVDVHGSLYVYSDYLNAIRHAVMLVPERYREDFYWGVGWQFRKRFYRDWKRVMSWNSKLPPEGRTPALEGSFNFSKWRGY